MNQSQKLQQFINNHLQQIIPLQREAALAGWQLQTEGTIEARDRSAELRAKTAAIYANEEHYQFLASLNPKELEDEVLKREHSLLLRSFRTGRMTPEAIQNIAVFSADIAFTFNEHRAILQGKEVTDNELNAVLQSSSSAELRKEAWEAGKTIGENVVERVLQLAVLRNEEAKRLGFRDYYALSLYNQEIEEERLFEILDHLEKSMDPLWRKYRDELDKKLAERFHTTPEQIRPWHHDNSFFQTVSKGESEVETLLTPIDPAKTTQQYFENIGLPVEDLMQKADLYERPGKCQHAFCLNVDREGDIRVLCNITPSERWCTTTMHEFGHAAYDKYIPKQVPFLLRRPAHTMTTESVALLMGRFTHNPHWLQRYTGASEESIVRLAKPARKAALENLLVFTHWCLVMAHFERALYANPHQDLNTLWWDLVERFQRVARPENRDKPDWASKIHVASHPVYYHNYLLGEMMATQILHYAENTVLAHLPESDRLLSPEFGKYLQNRLFAPGAVRPWEEWLEYAAGAKLQPDVFVQQVERL